MPPPTPFDFSWFHRVLILQWVSIGWEELLSYNTPKSSFLLLNSTKDSNHHTNMSQISKNPNYENQQQIPTIKKPFFKKTQTTHFSYHKNQSNSKRKKNNNTNSSIERKKKKRRGEENCIYREQKWPFQEQRGQRLENDRHPCGLWRWI